MLDLLVVCVGNICRSPDAAAQLARALPEARVQSAGLQARVGEPADAQSAAVAAEHGLDLSVHVARQITTRMCEAADLILVMSQEIKADLQSRFQLTRGKVFRLGEIGGFDIADPYRQPRDAFDRAHAEIARGVADWMPRLRRLN